MKEYTSEQLVSNGILVDQTFNSMECYWMCKIK